MFRCTIISAFLHGLLIGGMLLLSLFGPPHRKQQITEISISFSGGAKDKKPGISPQALAAENSEPAPAATPAPTAAPTPAKKAEPAPTPAPKITPRPSPRPPSPTPAPRLTPVPPQPTKPPIVVPKVTPKPTPAVVATKTPPPTVKTPVPHINSVAPRKIIVPKKKRAELVELSHAPVPTPTPKATPAPAVPTDELANAVEQNAKPAVPPAQPQVAEFPNPDQAPPSVPVPASPAPTPTGTGGKGTAIKASPGSALSGSLVVPGGEGGGNGGSGPAGTGSILNSVSQTYFLSVMMRIEENFKLANAYPGVTCQVQFTIQKDGTITDIKLIRKSGYENLDALAIQALNMTKLPALYDGMQRTSLPVILTFDFAKKEF